MIGKPYSFKPSLEQLRHLKNLSPKEKLDWLEEANEFVTAFVSQDQIERWKRLTSGKQA